MDGRGTTGADLARVAGTGMAAGSAALAWALFEARWYARRWLTVPAMAPGARPLRLLHLSDLHLLPGQQRLGRFVRSCLEAGPDVVVLTGDILGHGDALDEAVALLGPLADGHIALFTLGSNDFYGPVAKNPTRYFSRRAVHLGGGRLDTDRLVDGLTSAGWTCVENRRMPVATPAGTVDVLGLGDAHIDHDDPRGWARRSDGGSDRDLAPTGTHVLRLGVAHAPYLRVLQAFSDCGADLVLAGHTHGGQIRVPGVGALVDNCDLPLRQARGLSAHAPGMWLHVSAGLGTNLYTPIRFACRPEASILDVVARPAEAEAAVARPASTARVPGALR